ncbi:hypothetical protein Tco_1245432 [Tanacetum coccineum]
MEAHLAPTQPTQVNKITTSCEICSGPHDTQYCMKDPEQAFVEYASSRTDEAGGKWYTFKPEQINLGDTYNLSWRSHLNLSHITTIEDIPSNTVKNLKLSTTLVLSAHSYPTEDPQCSTHIHSSINAITIHLKQPKESQVNEPDVEQEEVMVESNVSIEIIRDDDEPRNEGPNKGEGAAMGEPVVEYFDIFPTRDELTYHREVLSFDKIKPQP